MVLKLPLKVTDCRGKKWQLCFWMKHTQYTYAHSGAHTPPGGVYHLLTTLLGVLQRNKYPGEKDQDDKGCQPAGGDE